MLKWKYCLTIFIAIVAVISLLKLAEQPREKIIVAVVDTGIDLKQIRFKLAATQGFNVFNPDKPPQDDNGHGTQVASIIHFLEPRIKIMPIKAIPKSGVATKQELAQGIIAAVNRGAKIINISAGVVSSSLDLENTVRYAEEKGVFIVAAVGGDGSAIDYPAAYPAVLAVGGVDHNGARLPNSSTGTELDIMALGEYPTIGLRGECLTDAGTSLAVPIVSVYIARILRDNPNLKPQEVVDMLLNLTVDIGRPGKDDETGHGLLKQKEDISKICK